MLISDDSDDSIQPLVKELALDFNAIWIPGPRRGLYANRNNVANQCRGTHVFSADDDHEHPKDFLEKCLRAVHEDRQAAWCLGEVWAWKDLDKGWLLPGELTLKGVPDGPADPSNTWAWSDGATICPKKVFDSGLIFCESFRFGWSYLEFGSLLHARGQRIRLLDSTGVVHHLHEIGRSYELPLEELAASYFALLMLALIYQPTYGNRLLLLTYFVKQILRSPVRTSRTLPRAISELRVRAKWLREWDLAHPSGFVTLEK